MNNEARGHAEVILRLISGGDFRETRQQVFDLERPYRKAMREAVIEAAADSHGKRVLRTGHAEAAGRFVRHAKQNLAVRRDSAKVSIGNTRTEQIRVERTVYAVTADVAAGVSAEI